MNVALTGTPSFSRTTRGVVLLYNYLLSKDVKPREEEFASDYIQVNYTTLQAFLGKENYVDVLRQLVDNNYLERLEYDEYGQYYPGGYFQVADEKEGIIGRCKSFRVPAHLLDDSYQILEMELTKTEGTKIQNAKKPRVRYEEPYREFIRENMDDIVLVDTIESRQILSRLYTEGRIRVNAEQYLDMWNNNIFQEASVDDFGYRVHGPITSAPRELRPFMRFKSDTASPLVEVDFVASQPSLLASITPALIRRFAPECAVAIPLFKVMKSNDDWERYKVKCLDVRVGHGIYDFLAQSYEREYNVPMIRDDGKSIYYRACFSNYSGLSHLSLSSSEAEHAWHMVNGNEQTLKRAASNLFTLRSYHLFKKAFPGVHQLFRNLKRLEWNVEGQGKPHANNCLLAQRIESVLIYTILVRALAERGIRKVVTIHDAIFIRHEEADNARKIIEQQLRKLRLDLKLKVK
ncbi:hypothetical protein K3G63_14725 [Hymenobacter sp. HSC-4F20]|uniref:hypothetical protein n=1 Tax=Hymenobacter sp. HSC-4F20 TaxID=2864135 RepID=UPI001C73D9B6|nr:hypothetical protein [Hymenobacter sp. HSC-4F20]MBX0291702.1 hypothetical protein [Hymenobacter sp. HSC-4F20]